MAIINRTPDSFYDNGSTFDLEPALVRLGEAVRDGADLVDVGGVRAGYGPDVDADEELRRTADFVSEARARFPDLVISVDTWRSEVADELCRLGADLVNDTWSGHDPELAAVAAQHGAGLVCSHTGGIGPRTDPHRSAYDDVVADVIETVTALAERALEAGVRRDGILIDPTHDFGKNTRHSLELTRRLDELVATGWPVLVALSNKDFIGETLDVDKDHRLPGTLGRDRRVGVAGGAGVPRPQRRRDPAGPRRRRVDPRRSAACRGPPRPRLNRPAGTRSTGSSRTCHKPRTMQVPDLPTARNDTR